jgi:hypothetical protein
LWGSAIFSGAPLLEAPFKNRRAINAKTYSLLIDRELDNVEMIFLILFSEIFSVKFWGAQFSTTNCSCEITTSDNV